MEENRNQEPTLQEDEYVERPAWQVWGARVGLVFFIIFVIIQILQIAGGGL